VSCVHPSILGFHTQHVSISFFKVQCTVSCDIARIWIEMENEASTCRSIEEGIGDLCINAFVLICGRHSQHRSSLGHIFFETNSVYVLAEHRSIIVGVSDFDPNLGGAA
uniref:Uncharacterized protein n=1 Tax=Marmota marmota marmota TaxID=9994 RepID=A0A8C5ZE77_MARMA